MSRVWRQSHFSRNFHMKSHIQKISQSRAYLMPNTMLPWLTLLKTTTTRFLICCKLTGSCWHSNRLGIKEYRTPALVAFTFRSRINKCILQLSVLRTVIICTWFCTSGILGALVFAQPCTEAFQVRPRFQNPRLHSDLIFGILGYFQLTYNLLHFR